MNTQMYRLGFSDVKKGLISAVLGALFVSVVATLTGVVSTPGFDLFTTDWTAIWHNITNVGFVAAYGAASGYLTKNFFTDDSGMLFGKYKM